MDGREPTETGRGGGATRPEELTPGRSEGGEFV